MTVDRAVVAFVLAACEAGAVACTVYRVRRYVAALGRCVDEVQVDAAHARPRDRDPSVDVVLSELDGVPVVAAYVRRAGVRDLRAEVARIPTDERDLRAFVLAYRTIFDLDVARYVARDTL